MKMRSDSTITKRQKAELRKHFEALGLHLPGWFFEGMFYQDLSNLAAQALYARNRVTHENTAVLGATPAMEVVNRPTPEPTSPQQVAEYLSERYGSWGIAREILERGTTIFLNQQFFRDRHQDQDPDEQHKQPMPDPDCDYCAGSGLVPADPQGNWMGVTIMKACSCTKGHQAAQAAQAAQTLEDVGLDRDDAREVTGVQARSCPSCHSIGYGPVCADPWHRGRGNTDL
jgi:hypothetical protein